MFVFTALHGIQTRSSDEISVCPSVCLSNACIVTKRKKNLSRFFYLAKDHSVWYSEKKNGGWGDPLYLKFRVNLPLWSEIADFEPIIAHSASAIRPSKKVQLTLIGSPLRAFQRAQDGSKKSRFGAEMRTQTWKWTELLQVQVLVVTTTSSHAGSQELPQCLHSMYVCIYSSKNNTTEAL